jgi:hypothetical protein
MEKEERTGSPLGAPHLGMDYFPVFDSRLDDSPKFRAQLQAWTERSAKFEACLRDLKERLIDYHDTGVAHNEAARNLVGKMEYLTTMVEEEKGLEEISAPIKQFTDILSKVWTFHKESNLRQTDSFAKELDDIVSNIAQVNESYEDVLLARSTSQMAAEKFSACKQSQKMSDLNAWSAPAEVALLTRTAYLKVLSQHMVSLRSCHSINMLKFMQKMMDFMLTEFSHFNFSTSLFKNLESYWDKLFHQVKDEKGTCEADLKTYTKLQKYVQKKCVKSYFEGREAVGLADFDPNLNLLRVTDALQSVLSSYQPLMGHEKKAFLKPLQQVFPNYEKELQALSKGKMKKSRSIEWELISDCEIPSSVVGDGNSVTLVRTSSADCEIHDSSTEKGGISKDLQIGGETEGEPSDPNDEEGLGGKRRPRIFSFGRKYSPLEQRQRMAPQPSLSSPLAEDGNFSVPQKSSSSTYSPKSSSHKPHALKGVLKRAKGSLVQMVTSKNQGDGTNDHYLGALGDDSSDEGSEGVESQWEEPLEPVPPSWGKYGYVMIGEKPQSGKVKWTERYCIVDHERGELLFQTDNMEKPEVLCGLLLSSAKASTQEHMDRDHCIRVSWSSFPFGVRVE